jgi:hypothetical protein
MDGSLQFQDECNHLPFGDHLSVYKGAQDKPLIMLGQDECIFKQFNLTKNPGQIQTKHEHFYQKMMGKVL